MSPALWHSVAPLIHYIHRPDALYTGFPVKPLKPGDLNFICPGPEIAWNLSKTVRNSEQNNKFSKKN